MIGGFDETWCLDFEFHAPPGERPLPLCMVAKEIISGRVIRLWLDGASHPVPFRTNERVLFVAYYASAEIGCFLALGWPLPQRVLDLCAEFKCKTSGITLPDKKNLLGALIYHGLPCIDAAEKESMRQLAIRGGPFTNDEKHDLLEYCETDVVALEKLLPKMEPAIDLPRALLRGRYMVSVAKMKRTGVPMDAPLLSRLREQWPHIQGTLIAEIDKDYGVFDGLVFKRDRFEQYLLRENIAWPRLQSGALDLRDETFRDMAKSHRRISSLRELRHALGKMRNNELAVGSDGRNRCMLGAFGSKTGRNQPSNSEFIFGPSVWLRGLIKPEPGQALAYVDWSQQEFGIAAALSGDKAMMEAYITGDPYLAFAKQAGAVPADATKQSHSATREQFKQAALAVQYGMAEASLAVKINQPVIRARELLRLHRRTYPRFWQWIEGVVQHAMAFNQVHTVFGWQLHVDANIKRGTLLNFPMQANGAEMLRLACCLATERGIKVCAPVHDALLIQAHIDAIKAEVARTQQAMIEASRTVLGGFELRSDVKIVRYPDRYMDERGAKMWQTVMGLLPPPAVG